MTKNKPRFLFMAAAAMILSVLACGQPIVKTESLRKVVQTSTAAPLPTLLDDPSRTYLIDNGVSVNVRNAPNGPVVGVIIGPRLIIANCDLGGEWCAVETEFRCDYLCWMKRACLVADWERCEAK